MVTKKSISDGLVSLCTLKYNKFGVKSFNGLEFANEFIGSDGGNGALMVSLDADGNLHSNDVIIKGGGTSMNTDARIYYNSVRAIDYNDMLDEYCDKFYWKRTA